MSSHSEGPHQTRGQHVALLGVALSLVAVPGIWAERGNLRALVRPPAAGHVLRVCADPDNLPYSNRAGAGFENRIAMLIARDIHATVAYTWWPEQRSFLRNTLRAGRCDVVLGTAAGTARVLTTDPYYCSTYVFVSRPGSHAGIDSFDDPALGRLRIGVPVIGQDYNSLPPNVALAHRHLVNHVVGYVLYAGEPDRSPWYKLLQGVEQGDVDLAIAWGPPAGYFGRRAPVPLAVTPVVDSARNDAPFIYAIAAAVRPADTSMRTLLNGVLTHERPAIDAILRSYNVPLVHGSSAASAAGGSELRCS